MIYANNISFFFIFYVGCPCFLPNCHYARVSKSRAQGTQAKTRTTLVGHSPFGMLQSRMATTMQADVKTCCTGLKSSFVALGASGANLMIAAPYRNYQATERTSFGNLSGSITQRKYATFHNLLACHSNT